jgi:hypothetical protein
MKTSSTSVENLIAIKDIWKSELLLCGKPKVKLSGSPQVQNGSFSFNSVILFKNVNAETRTHTNAHTLLDSPVTESSLCSSIH